MAKRRKSTMVGPATPADMNRWSAESMADGMMRNHPMMKKMRDHISDEVMKAGEHATKKMMGKMKMKKGGGEHKGMME